VTGGVRTGTDVTATVQPIGTMLRDMPKPVHMGNKLIHQAQWDALALQIVQSVGFTTFDYDLYQLPVNTTWGRYSRILHN
jgi:hypothetical protein